MRRTKRAGRYASQRATPLALLLATGLWGAHSLTGCGVESIRVGAFGDAGSAGELSSDGGAADPGGTGSGGRFVQGGRGNAGGSDSEGGEASGGRAASAGSSGSPGNGGFAGSIAGHGGESAVGGSIGYAGSAGSGAQAGSGGYAGNGGSAGTFGDAGAAGTGEVWELAAPDEAPCGQAICTGKFEWRNAEVSDVEAYFADLSGDGQVVAGFLYGASLRAYRLDWDSGVMRTVPTDEIFWPRACSFTGTTLVGMYMRVTGGGVPEALPDVPVSFEAVAVSDDGNVITGYDGPQSSYVIRGAEATPISGVTYRTVSGNGNVFGGTRISDRRAVIVTAAGELTELPVAGAWRPRAVHALSEDGSVAVGYASTAADSDHEQAFRWAKGADLELLGVPEETTTTSTAQDCNADCSIVVGSPADSASGEPFVYTAEGGTVTLAEYAFEHTGLVVPADFTADFSATTIRISADGRLIAGEGLSSGVHVLFYFQVDQPGALPNE